MRLRERLLVSFAILCSLMLCGTAKDRKESHLLALLGYLHGYKIGQDFGLQFPSYFVSPIFVVPSINQQQNVNIQNGATDETYHEIGNTIQKICSVKLVKDDSKIFNQTKKHNETNKRNPITDKYNEDDLKQALKRDTEKYASHSENETCSNNDSLRQNVEESTTIANKANTTFPPSAENYTDTTNIEKIETTTKTSGLYPNPAYDNQLVNNLTLTTPPEESLPPVSDNRWQNFTLRANLTIDVNNNTMINGGQNNTVSPSDVATENTKPVTSLNNGPYPNAQYNNAMIDQLSITTNSYTNELLPSQDDRWEMFSNKLSVQKSEGFRPLAGLYYDGFLHRPLKKFGFIPQNYVW